jgi:hypothetical protein
LILTWIGLLKELRSAEGGRIAGREVEAAGRTAVGLGAVAC